MKRLLSVLLFSTVFTAVVSAQLTEVRKKQFNVDESGLAIKGYDPVAYFTSNKAIEGKKDITLGYQGITYRFATTANRDAFKANPGKYEPLYGGWCAYAMDKFFNNTLKSWNKDEAHLKTNADKNWMKFAQ